MRFKEILLFSYYERHSIFILLIIILISSFVYWNNNEITTAYQSKFKRRNVFVKKEFIHFHRPSFQNQKHNITLFEFDPNTISIADLQRLGLSKKQALVLNNYRNKGGIFRKSEDLLKIYSIDKNTFNRIFPYIKIKEPQFTNQRKQHEIRRIDINTASIQELEKLPIIGPRRAEIISQYRLKINGFYSSNQIAQLLHVTSLQLDSLLRYIFIDTQKIKKININDISFSDLKSNPLFGYYTTKKIFNYKKIAGKVSLPADLFKNKIIDSLTYSVIRHYITCE